MKRSNLDFSYVKPEENVGIPPPMKYAGLYSSDLPYTNTTWSKEYRGERVAPDAVAFSTQYDKLAQKHIPTSVRPGNNYIIDNPYEFTDDKSNTMCFKSPNQ